MTDTSRRDLLTGAAGLAAGSVLALPAPVRAEEVPLKIEPSARYLEIRSLQKKLAEVDAVEPRDDTAFAEAWNRIMEIQSGISHRPTSLSELLDYATVMLFWNTATADGGLDPCETLMRTRTHRTRSYLPEQTAVDLASAVFALAGCRAESHVRWARLREDPDL
jgi:hypothetical protein